MTRCIEHGTDISGSVKLSERLDWLRDCWLFKKDSAACSQELRALYLENKVFFRLYPGFRWKEFAETSHLSLPTRTLQTL
jgi:hypothetical protein